MMPLRKIKAFTLLEVLLTMLLTILVIGITYSAYIIIDKQFKRSKTAEERMYELSLLSYLIERDVNSAKMILCRADGFLARMNETDA
jgi:type II secretory pathway component PulJ